MNDNWELLRNILPNASKTTNEREGHVAFKKIPPKQNKTKQSEILAQKESGNRYETNKQNKARKNENLYKNGRKANLKVIQVGIIEL